jgi:hypothetical protein
MAIFHVCARLLSRRAFDVFPFGQIITAKPPENLITEHYNQPSIKLSIYYCNKTRIGMQNKSEVNFL